jgi:hypothetical protein
MDDLNYKHFFVVENGKMIFEDKEMFKAKMMMLEGKRSYAIMEEVKQEVTPNQYAYYFAGIIRRECLNSEDFGGWTEDEVHSYLLGTLRGIEKTIRKKDGLYKSRILPDFKKFGKRKMTAYVDEVIAYLQTEHNIHPKPAEHYKYNKYYFNPKTYE